MSYYNSDMYELILKYLREVYPGHYENYTYLDLLKQPYHKQIWVWWTARAYYRMDAHIYTRIEDAPPDSPEGTWIGVMGKEEEINYRMQDGKWKLVQTITKEDVKNVFGNDTPGYS